MSFISGKQWVHYFWCRHTGRCLRRRAPGTRRVITIQTRVIVMRTRSCSVTRRGMRTERSREDSKIQRKKGEIYLFYYKCTDINFIKYIYRISLFQTEISFLSIGTGMRAFHFLSQRDYIFLLSCCKSWRHFTSYKISILSLFFPI